MEENFYGWVFYKEFVSIRNDPGTDPIFVPAEGADMAGYKFLLKEKLYDGDHPHVRMEAIEVGEAAVYMLEQVAPSEPVEGLDDGELPITAKTGQKIRARRPTIGDEVLVPMPQGYPSVNVGDVLSYNATTNVLEKDVIVP